MSQLFAILSAVVSFQISLISYNPIPEHISKSKFIPFSDTISPAQNSDLSAYGFRNLFNSQGFDARQGYFSQVNPNAEIFMKGYLEKQGAYLMDLKKKVGKQFDLIGGVFKQEKLPYELRYLAVIESNMDPHVISSAGAAGPWQFMPETARQYGLTVTPGKDERYDYMKSTKAVAIMLKELFAKYDDWLLVVAAYNGGPARVDQAITTAKTKDFWKLQYYLPEESRNHVKKFIATHYIMESKDAAFVNKTNTKSTQKNIKKISTDSTLQKLSISGKYLSSVIISKLKIDRQLFVNLNPRFEETMSISGSYELQLPEKIMNDFKLKKNEILLASVQKLLNE